MSGFPIEVATRIKTLPPYLFAAIDTMKQAAIARGVDIINLGIGDPDLPTPIPIVERLGKAAKDPKHHQYPSYEGMLSSGRAHILGTAIRFRVLPSPNETAAHRQERHSGTLVGGRCRNRPRAHSLWGGRTLLHAIRRPRKTPGVC